MVINMKHLTVDEMIDFVSFEKIDNGIIDLASKVNTHILKCESCRKETLAFQIIYDELLRLGRSADFKKLMREKLNQLTDDSNRNLTDELDVYR